MNNDFHNLKVRLIVSICMPMVPRRFDFPYPAELKTLCERRAQLISCPPRHDFNTVKNEKSHRRDNRQREGIQRSAKVDVPGLVNFIPAVAYHSCLNLPAAFTQPGAPTLADLFTVERTAGIVPPL